MRLASLDQKTTAVTTTYMVDTLVALDIIGTDIYGHVRWKTDNDNA